MRCIRKSCSAFVLTRHGPDGDGGFRFAQHGGGKIAHIVHGVIVLLFYRVLSGFQIPDVLLTFAQTVRAGVADDDFSAFQQIRGAAYAGKHVVVRLFYVPAAPPQKLNEAGGRRVNNNKGSAKYVNSPESELFVKNRSLYGIFEAKAAIVKEQKCYLVEGYTDVISFHQAGIENVVSSGGTSLTEGQIALIKRFSNKITVLYDGDLAGIKASIRGIDMLLAEGMEVKVALFPDGEDPDSFARKHSATELQAFLESHEEDFIAFKYELLKDDFARDPLQRAKLINDILVSISVIPDAIVRNVYMEETAKRLNVKEELLARELARMRIKRQESIIKREETQARRRDWEETQLPKFVTNTYCEEAEKEILYYLLKYGNRQLHLDEDFLYGADISQSQTVAEYILCQLQNDDLELQNLLYKNIFNEYYTLQERDEERVLRHFANNPDTSVSKLVLDLMVQPYTITIENFKKSLIPEENILGRAVPKAILVYKAKITAQASLHLTEELGKAQKEGNLELQTQIMEQLNALIQVRNVFSKELKRITF